MTSFVQNCFYFCMCRGLCVVIIWWCVVGLCSPDDGSLFNCLEGRAYCERESRCVRMLQNLPHICRSDVFFSCNSSDQNKCQTVQKWLQSVPGLEKCHCYVDNQYLELCLQIQNLVFSNRCIKGQGPLPRPPHFREEREEGYDYIDAREEGGGTDDDHYYDYDDDEDDEEMYYGKDTPISCIGVRKHCIQDDTCGRKLLDYRRFCKENKKKGTCVTKDIQECYDTTQALQSSGLFQCQCHMKRPRTRAKCDRIQDRIANNTCLVTVPYLYHASKTLATSYDDLLSLISSSVKQPAQDQMEYVYSWQAQHGVASESTCVQAFTRCNEDSGCRMSMAEFMVSCGWNKKRSRIPQCDREGCLAAIKRFYILVRSEQSQGLLFCQCQSGDYKCEAVRQGLYPMCATASAPQHTCTNVMHACETDPDCKKRWQSYETDCQYDKIRGGCVSGSVNCRRAQVGIMGTVITTNCSCPTTLNESEHRTCQEAKRRLQQNNICKDIAIQDYNAPRTTTPYEARLWKDAQIKAEDEQGCRAHLGYRLPKYMPLPFVIRMYTNSTDCSNICQCSSNGTLACNRLKCPLPHPCKEGVKTYEHGTGFVRGEAGQCRCIKGEIVCAKPQGIRIQQKDGLFLYIGFSISDRYLLEDQSPVRFDVYEISEKLAALLNAEAEEQICLLSLYHQQEGNILFEVKLSRYSKNMNIIETCGKPITTLVSQINSRAPAVVTDAQLSMLKVAELEKDSSRGPYASANEQYSESSSSRTRSLPKNSGIAPQKNGGSKNSLAIIPWIANAWPSSPYFITQSITPVLCTFLSITMFCFTINLISKSLCQIHSLFDWR